MSSKIFKTFNEWSSQGYKIKKGSKATWIADIPKFSEDQVVYSPRRRGYNNYHTDYIYGELEYEDLFDPWMS